MQLLAKLRRAGGQEERQATSPMSWPARLTAGVQTAAARVHAQRAGLDPPSWPVPKPTRPGPRLSRPDRAGHPDAAPCAAVHHRPRRPPPVTTAGALTGFDTCTAPSLAAMKAWKAKYSAVAVYIGGAEMGCSYGNLSRSWVSWPRAWAGP